MRIISTRTVLATLRVNRTRTGTRTHAWSTRTRTTPTGTTAILTETPGRSADLRYPFFEFAQLCPPDPVRGVRPLAIEACLECGAKVGTHRKLAMAAGERVLNQRLRAVCVSEGRL